LPLTERRKKKKGIPKNRKKPAAADKDHTRERGRAKGKGRLSKKKK